MPVDTTAFSLAIVKLSEAKEKENRPSYLKAVVAGLPVVGAQALSDIPEGMIERGVQNQILKAGKLPSAGSLMNVGGVRFASRIGAGTLTTPLFVSGMNDIAHAKNKKEERAGLAKLVAAGGVYAGLRGGIEAGLDTEYRHLPALDRVKRVAGPKALRGIASATATGLMVGRGLRKQREDKNPSVFKKYVTPAAIGAGMAGLGGLYEAGIAEGFRTPEARWRVGAKVGGKAAAGAAATLFLSELMERALRGKEKRAEVGDQFAPTPTNLNTQTAAWAKSADTKDILRFYAELRARGGERSPSSRAAYYALHDELSRRGEKLDQLEMREQTSGKVRVSPWAGAATVALVTVPSLAFSSIMKLPATERDQVLSDALDNLYVQGKIHKYTEGKSGPIQRGQEYSIPHLNSLVVSTKSDPAVVAHEIGHIRASKIRRATLQSDLVRSVFRTGQAASIAIPVVAFVSSKDGSYATPEEMKSKASVVATLGTVAAVAQAPTIAEEGIASAKALAYLKRSGATNSEVAEKAVKVLAPALGTYSAPAAVPFLAAAWLRHAANQKVEPSK